MQKVIIVGAGVMGAGVAQVVAQAGNTVVVKEVSDALLQQGLETIEKSLGKAVAKEKLTSERKAEILGNIRGIVSSADLRKEARQADLVIEAIVERIDAKRELFRELDAMCPAKTILSTNTSAFSVTELAASTKREDRFVGLHFFNPATMMELVEVIAGQNTSTETLDRATEFVENIGKTPARVADSVGFIVNRLLVPMVNEAAFIVQEGVASAEDVDKAMRLGANLPMGPLALADLIGVDVCLSVMETLQRETGDPKYRPCPILRRLVRAGNLGRKTGRGFYTY